MRGWHVQVMQEETPSETFKADIEKIAPVMVINEETVKKKNQKDDTAEPKR